MSKPLRILFLSAIDFKEKSIQVIRKTPEAFVEAGWDVDYIVGRDSSKWGNYHYEDVFNPDNITVTRIEYPIKRLRDDLSIRKIRVFFNKLALLILIFRMKREAVKLIDKYDYDVVYGYEIHGVIALKLLKLTGKVKGIKTVYRFQGSWLPRYYKDKNILKIAGNLDAVIASRGKADAVIMTDDGTQGDYLYRKYNGENFKFWLNGVNPFVFDESAVNELKKKHDINNEVVFLSVSRLEGWKRVDRCINIINELVNGLGYTNIKYIVVGGGAKKEELEHLVKRYKLDKYIDFTGPVEHQRVKDYFGAADIFFSMYDLSNVGNPLLEAIRSHKIIFTLDNGDTSKWIEHGKTGFIYSPDNELAVKAAEDVFELVNNKNCRKIITKNVKDLDCERLWTWNERFKAETDLVFDLANK